jgi:hypothetical protein
MLRRSILFAALQSPRKTHLTHVRLVRALLGTP